MLQPKPIFFLMLAVMTKSMEQPWAPLFTRGYSVSPALTRVYFLKRSFADNKFIVKTFVCFFKNKLFNYAVYNYFRNHSNYGIQSAYNQDICFVSNYFSHIGRQTRKYEINSQHVTSRNFRLPRAQS